MKAFVWEPTTAALIFAMILIAPILAGFLLPIQPFIVPYVPPFEGLGGTLMPNLQAQPYPQVCAFRTSTRNLWILLIPALLAIGLSAAMFSSPAETPSVLSSDAAQQQPADYSPGRYDWMGALWWLIPLIFWGAAMLVTTWIRERILLLKSVARLGVLVAAHGGEFSYWFYDEHGDRLGGFAPHCAGVAIISPFIPVFCSPKNSNRHRPGFAFLFHGFVVTDSRHLPPEMIQHRDGDTVEG